MTMLEERGPKPYGDVAYADPKNGKYPIDTRIRAAMKKIGADVDDGQTAADRAVFELRRRHRLSMTAGLKERRGMSFSAGNVEVRSAPDGTGGTSFVFEGYGSVFDSPFDMWDKWGDPYTETVMQGAFTQSLGRPDLDVPFLIGHNDAGIPLARTRAGTMQLSQDSHGLHVLAQMDGGRSDVRDLASAVERGDLDEMSIGFVTRGQEWSEDYEHRSMLDLDIHRGDVSAVALGASQATAGSTMTPLPVAHLSRQAPAESLMLDGTAKRLPIIDAALDQAQKLFATVDTTKLPPEVAQGIDLVASASIHTDHILKHENLPDPDKGETSKWSADNPDTEERVNPVDLNLGDAPDYNPWKCRAPDCPVTGGAVNPSGSLFCSRCGKPLGGKDVAGGDRVITMEDGIPSDERPGGLGSLAAEKARHEQRQRDLALLLLA